MVLNTGFLNWESSTLNTRALRLTPSFPKCCIEKRKNTCLSKEYEIKTKMAQEQ